MEKMIFIIIAITIIFVGCIGKSTDDRGDLLYQMEKYESNKINTYEENATTTDEIKGDLKDIPLIKNAERKWSIISKYDINISDINEAEMKGIYTGTYYIYSIGYMISNINYTSVIEFYNNNFSGWKLKGIKQESVKINPLFLPFTIFFPTIKEGEVTRSELYYQKCDGIFCPELTISISYSEPVMIEIMCKKRDFVIENITYLNQRYGSITPSKEEIEANVNACLR
ncbi:MAG: hypothetical protein QW054_01290 [Candidatus Micrarchaeia archaeon]